MGKTHPENGEPKERGSIQGVRWQVSLASSAELKRFLFHQKLTPEMDFKCGLAN